MRIPLSFLLLCLFLLFSCQSQKGDQAKLSKSDVKRVVLLGGSLIANMEDHGFFEQGLIRHFPSNAVSLRNIAWPADDVFGLARSQFGSAQNTMSWAPPTAEEGFGSKVLAEHIEEADPSTLIIGYGSNAAYFETEEELELFKSGYQTLLDLAEAKKIKIVLSSPPKQEASKVDAETINQRNDWLGKATAFIKELAEEKGHDFIDLYNNLITNPSKKQFTENGIQLNKIGYKRMSELMLESLGIEATSQFRIELDTEAQMVSSKYCSVSNWESTVNGVSFLLEPDKMLYHGEIISEEPIAIYVNGKLVANSQDTLSIINVDSLRYTRLASTIEEKNRLHRYRLQPLNEAYIYLFRRHEMGHLAYEMDDLQKLVAEKEREVNSMLNSETYYVEIEKIKPWQPPKNYPEDEVPAFIPAPNIEEEIAAFNIADGYEISLFASDPMIANPININWDTKGRAWVATSSTYPHIVPGREPNDKVVILEDTDNDGKADKHTVFAENMLVPHSVMPVPGGAYVAATTELLFFADTDGDDVADERRVVYDGFGNADVHHMIHGLRWAPWGDLHFTQSIYINSFIETPYGNRILNGSGTWSFRPETERLEIFSRGLVNPWGEAFDQWGQAFATDGAGGSGINYIFPESAHATAVGAARVVNGLNSGTPKNTAAEVIYSRHFPASWQGSIITNDFRANRTVRYEVQPSKSGYTSKEVQTILQSDHRSYRPVDSKIGPDGALYIVDWYNPIIDHGEVDFHHPIRDKSHGRIWKLTRKGSPLLKPNDMASKTQIELLELLKSPEQFTRLQANRAFVEQQGDAQLVVNWIKSLSKASAKYYNNRLEGLWLLAAINHYDEGLLLSALKSTKAQERAAAVRLLAHYQEQKEHTSLLAQLINDPHPQVRLEALHALRQMGGLQASELAMQVLDHPIDENLNFALEVTIKELQENWLPAIVRKEKVFDESQQKQLYALLTSEDERVINPINQLLAQPNIDTDLAKQAWMLLAKIGDAQTRDKVLQKAANDEDPNLLLAMANAPSAKDAVPQNLKLLENLLSHENMDLRLGSLKLAGRWNATQCAALVSEKVIKAEAQREKLAALRALVGMGQLEEVKALASSSSTPEISAAATAVWVEEEAEAAVTKAVNILAEVDDPSLAELLFNTFRRSEEGPKILAKALEGKTIPEANASVGLRVVQTSGLNLFDLEEAIRKAGAIKSIGMEMSQTEKEQLINDAEENGNRHRGREIYRRKELLCATCHRVNKIGGLTGPNLTTVGSYMTPNSLLESILNPNTDIKQGYETVLVTKKGGKIISGLLHRKTNNSTIVRQANGDLLDIPASEIEQTDVSPISLMPAGLTRNLHKDELKDLLAYMISLGKEN